MNMTEIEARGKIKYRIANEMRKYVENKEEYEDLEIALQVMKEIREYRELGTVEELQELKDKNEPKKPILSKSMMTKKEFQICPVCERLVLYDGIKFNYCQYCGQKLDWEGGGNNAESN